MGIKQTLKKCARALGYHVQVYSPKTSPDLRRQLLLSRLQCDLVIDVGANEGQYAQTLREFGYQGNIHSYEPLPDAFEKLQMNARSDSRWKVTSSAVGAKAGQIEFNISGNSVSSSALEMEQLHENAAPDSRYIKKLQVPVCRLDDSYSEWKNFSGIWLKADTQGFEKNVIEGAALLLKKCKGVELELSLRPLYKGAPLYSEMIDVMSSAGFRLFAVEPGFMDDETGELYQANGIFVRS